MGDLLTCPLNMLTGINLLCVQYGGLDMSPSLYEEAEGGDGVASHTPDRCIVVGGCLDCRAPGRTVSVLVDDYFATGLECQFTPIRNKVGLHLQL
jgi:hypothetical protein